MSLTYQLLSCPVPVTDWNKYDPFTALGEYVPCGVDLSSEVEVHAEGAEHGVRTSGESCAAGHASRTIATAEQYALLGIDF